MKAELLEQASRAVDLGQSMGADQIEAYAINEEELTIEVRNQEIETLKEAATRGIGIRILAGGRMGFAFTSDTTETGLKDATGQAMANARFTAEDPYTVVPEPAAEYPALELFDGGLERATLDGKIALAMEVERVARDHDSRVKITESCSYQDTKYEVALANSRGLAQGYRGSYCGIYALVVAVAEGDQQTGFGIKYTLRFSDLDPQRVGRDAAERAVRMLGAETMPTRRFEVVLEPYIATSFLGLIAPALSAEAVQKNRSLLKGRMGETIASSLVNLVDNGKMAGGLLSAPFDGEGVLTRELELIKDGRLTGFLHNSYSAAREGVKSTGNAVRPSFKNTPEVGTSNLYIRPGKISREELIGKVHEGFYVTEVMGMHTANPISGDFSVGAAGLLIKNGELATPVRGVVIAGNVIDLLRHVDAVADDLDFIIGRGSPTIRVSDMTVSGS